MTGTAKYLQISTSGKVRQNIEQAISKDSRKLIKLYQLVYQDSSNKQVRSEENLKQMLKSPGISNTQVPPEMEVQKQSPVRHKRQKSQIPVLSDQHALLDDYRIQTKVPALKVIKQQLSQGKISRKQYNDQAVEILSNASKSNKTVPALVQQIASEVINKSRSHRSQEVVDANALQEESKSVKVSSQQIETKFSKPRSEQDGMSIENKRVGAVLPTDLTALQDKHDAHSYIGSLLKRIQAQHPTDIEIASKISSVHKKLTGRELQLLEQNEVSSRRPIEDEQNVQQHDGFDAEQEPHPTSAIDLLSDRIYQSTVNAQLDKHILTDQQRSLAESVLFDIDGLMNNLDMISDNSSSSKISRLSSDFEDVTIEYEGKRYTAQQIMASIPRIVEYISKIEGNIDPTNTRLSDYKRTTEVFSTAIVKRETNQFKARQGQAFMTRACC